MRDAGALLFGRAVPIIAAPFAVGSGCKALIGETTIDAFIIVGAGGKSTFFGWTEYELDEPAAPDDSAILKRVLLHAPPGFDDLKFLLNVFGEAVREGERTALVSGVAADFPEDDTIAPLEVLYDDDLRPLFIDDQKIRIEWNGSVDPSFTYPEKGVRINAQVVIEVL